MIRCSLLSTVLSTLLPASLAPPRPSFSAPMLVSNAQNFLPPAAPPHEPFLIFPPPSPRPSFHLILPPPPPPSALPAIIRTRKTYGGPLVIGEDLMSFAISDIVEANDASGAPPTPLRAN